MSDQLRCLTNQTVLPRKVLIYQNLSYIPRLLLTNLFSNVMYTNNINWNSRYHGRFSCVLTLPEENYIFWDDDQEPGSDWNRYTLEVSCSFSSIVTANGRYINYSDDNISVQFKIGEIARNSDIESHTVVDYGGVKHRHFM